MTSPCPIPTRSPASLPLLVATFLLHLAATSSAFAPRARELFLVKQQPLVLEYHNGPLLKGPLTLNLIWYGSFTPAQRAIVSDFVNSLNPTPLSGPSQPPPSVSSWWATIEGYGAGGPTIITLGKQVVLEDYHLGTSLTVNDIRALTNAIQPNKEAVNVVLTAADVGVEGFCRSTCGSHSSGAIGSSRFAYIWVGNSATQCPGQCAWPFAQPYYGPQTPPLAPPNGDVGVDGMVVNLATLLAGTVTNPFDGGYFQGPATAPLEAVSACPGMFGAGAYPGYPGEVPVDEETGGSYNARGLYGRGYLLPAMWDPRTSQCAILV